MMKSVLYSLLCRFIFPNKGVTHIKRTPKLIVSLTSYPGRINVVERTIDSILRQSLKPDCVILWLAESQFSKKEKSLPKSLRHLLKHGLQIRWCEDIRSYKKLIPALREFPDDIIVTTDDDVIYDENWLEKLYTSFLKHPDEIHCHHAFDYVYDEIQGLGFPSIIKNEGVLEKCSMAIGIGGILYPPHLLYGDVCKTDIFSSLAPTNDDFWFWAMAKLNGLNIRLVSGHIDNIVCIEGTQGEGLWESENSKGEGSRQFKNIIERYPELQQFIKEGQ